MTSYVPPEQDESGSSGDPEPEPYAPCEKDADCAPVGAHPEETTCRYGTCAYACGNGWGDECPKHPTGAVCHKNESRCVVDRIESPPGCRNDCLHMCSEIEDTSDQADCTNGCLGTNPLLSCYVCPEGMEQEPQLTCVWDRDNV